MHTEQVEAALMQEAHTCMCSAMLLLSLSSRLPLASTLTSPRFCRSLSRASRALICSPSQDEPQP